MKHKLLILLLLLSYLNPIFAGDVAEFINLGFSDNGKYMSFAHYGYSVDKSETYANIYSIDVANNDYLTDGLYDMKKTSFLEAGDSGNGAFLLLVEKAAASRNKYKINYMNKGRLLYINSSFNEKAKVADGNKISNGDGSIPISFKDYQGGKVYTMSINQNVKGSGPSVTSTFGIDLKVQDDETKEVKNSKVGHPNFERRGVSNYFIERVILAPNEKYLIITIAKEEYSGSETGPNIRYMVETTAIN